MGAIPHKKLCWNCEGAVSREIDNCPYCGVYLHTFESETHTPWTIHSKQEDQEIPTPLYQTSSNPPPNDESSDTRDEALDESFSTQYPVWERLKEEVFPILFLMMGSLFFLFGLVLILFSKEGFFILKWPETQGIYFLLGAIPLMFLGWKFLSDMNEN